MGVVGGAIGFAAAYAWIMHPPPTYRSAALIQIERKGAEPDSNRTDAGTGLDDETFVVRGEQTLQRAAERLASKQVPEFRGHSPQDIAARLSTSPVLVVESASDQPSSNVISIEYEAADPTTPQMVVQSVVDGYTQHTRERFEKGDAEALSEILEARDQALRKLQDIEKRHDDFLKQTELVFVDGEPKSIHRKIADRFLVQREELMVQKSEIQSRIRSAELSRDNSDPRTAMLSLKGKNETASDVIDRNISRQLEKLQNELRDRASVRTRETELLPLQLERDEMLEEFGKNHFKVRGIQKQIDVVEKQIARMEAEEKEKEVMIKKIMSIGGKPEVELDPETEIRKRVDLAITALKTQLASIEQQLQAVNASYEEEAASAKAETEAIRESRRFESDIARQQELYEKVLARLDDAVLLSDDKGLVVSVLDSPGKGLVVERPVMNRGLTGALIGLISGIVLAMMFPPRQWRIPESPYPPPPPTAIGMPAPILGSVPMLAPRDASQQPVGALQYAPTDPRLCTVTAPYGREAAGFNALRATLLNSEAAAQHRIIQFTSAAPGVGKSTVIANLAVSVARSGKKVLLVDADLRESKLQGLFGLQGSHGLGWLLEQSCLHDSDEDSSHRIDEVMQAGPVSGLSIVPAGETRENPSELLAGERIDAFYGEVHDRFDLILVDSPPVLAVGDALDLARRSDAVAVVVKTAPDDAEQATHATNLLATVNANVIGVVINGATPHESGYRVHPAAYDLRIESGKV
jgi:capsular exopolysaccharide synthesis family protein